MTGNRKFKDLIMEKVAKDNGNSLAEPEVIEQTIDETLKEVLKEYEIGGHGDNFHKWLIAKIENEPNELDKIFDKTVYKFEIINPSDQAFIEGDYLTCVVATCLFGDGKYGLKQVDGDLELPPVFFMKDPDVWFKKKFGKTFKELFDESNKMEVANALLSIKLEGERSSLNNFTKYANDMGKRIKKSELEARVKEGESL